MNGSGIGRDKTKIDYGYRNHTVLNRKIILPKINSNYIFELPFSLQMTVLHVNTRKSEAKPRC
jgi:hypothetical protein